MMQLDIATLTLSYISLGVTAFIVLFLIWRINRDMPGVQMWMLGSMLNMASSLVMLINAMADLPEGFAAFASNSLSLPGNMLLMEGTLRFVGSASRRRWMLLLALVPVFMLASWINRYDAAARYLFHDSFLLIFMIVMAAALVWRREDREELAANALAAIAAGLMTLPVGLRWLLALTGNEQVMGGTDSIATQIYLFGGTMFYIMWIFGVSVACYYRSRLQVLQLAREDALTGLPNRRWIDERLGQSLVEARRSGEQFAVILIDINDFKQVNDQFGHSAGDLLLTGIGTRLRDAVREADFAGRLGGDEFIVIARQTNSKDMLDNMLDRLRSNLEGALSIPGGIFDVRVSIGAAICPSDGETADQLLGSADNRMYRDKALSKSH